MTTPRDPDGLIHAFLLEGAEQLEDQVYDVIRAEIDQKRQRVVIGPWRVPAMSKLVPIGLGAAAVIAVLFLGSQFIGSPTSNVGGPASLPPASAAPYEAPASEAPSPKTPPPLIESFTSAVHGISVSYPAGWIARAATAPYPEGTFYSLAVADPRLDVLHDPVLNDHLFLRIASQSVGDSSPEDWVAAQMAGDGSLGCTITEPITVDGATGLLGVEGCDVAVVATADRGYWIAIHASGDPQDVAPYDLAPYDRAWFAEVLATVQLRPEDAVDAAPSTTP